MQPRRATADDVPAIRALVASAYERYVPLIGKPPGPMLDDYVARVREDLVFVAETDGALAAILVLIEKPGHLLLDNIAVAPLLHGRGLGSQLVRFAEAEGRRRGFAEIRLYTHGAAAGCDLLLAVGSTLSVFPIAGVVPVAKRAGARIVILNAESTAMDDLADAVLRGAIGDLLPRLVGA